jgi:hypothetical protein
MEQECLDPYSIFKYAMNSPVTRDRYTTRLDRFFSFIGIEGTNIEERCRVFVQNAKKDNDWAFRSIINFLLVQKERVDRKEITGSTIRNYVKAIKLLTEMKLSLEKDNTRSSKGKEMGGRSCPYY